MEGTSITARVQFLKLIYILALSSVVLMLFRWQVLNYDLLRAKAEQQHFISYKIDGPRGVITSSDNAILAANTPTFLLYALPKVLENKNISKNDLVTKILAILNPEYSKEHREEFYSKLENNLEWVPLRKNISLEAKRQIERLNLEGIGFENELTRFYPEASTAAHILGFVGSDANGAQKGYFGVEGFYNGELKGIEGSVREEKDAQGFPILLGTFIKRDAKSGRNLVLNINRSVQYIVEKKLKEGIKKYGAKSASSVVMDPHTGAILAMASVPNFDPNRFIDFPKEYYKNPIVSDTYEPGSTFKIFVVASAINEGVVSVDTVCDECDDPVQVGGYFIRTWNNKYFPNTSVADVIVHSDNTGMVFIGRKLGVLKFYEYSQKFGFGENTQIDIEGEAETKLRSQDEWKEIDLATASFGQGIAVTPIQIVRAVSVIANGGKLFEPHMVKSIIDGDSVVEIKPKIVGNPVTEDTARVVKEMMVNAVEKGESKAFKPKGFKIAGKTGTAQIPVAGHYDPNKTVASFVGFAPADNPKFVMLVRYDEPSSSVFGSETAAPTFFEISKELFTYYNISPNE